MPIQQVRVLTLNGGEDLSRTLFRLEKGWVLRFVMGPSLHASPVRVFCNHPPSKDVPYDREVYYELKWRSPSGSRIDRHDVYTEVNIHMAGSFNYYFTVDESSSPDKPSGKGYFLVDPTLTFDDDDDIDNEITLDCIQCQTVLSKCLGPFNEWESRLRVAKETGYNMIHFTPIQELGQSNSAYSIRNQQVFSPMYSPGSIKYTFNDLEKLVNKMWKEWKVFSLTDLVLNHSANDSKWLQEHPECAYNLVNSPHLKPAYLVDRVLCHFSNDVAKGKWEGKGVPAKISEHYHLEAVRHVLMTEVIPPHKLHEFYTVDVEGYLNKFRKAMEEGKEVVTCKPKLEIIQDPEFHRLGSTVDMNTALRLYHTGRYDVSENERMNSCCAALEKKLHELNGEKMKEMEDHTQTIVNNFIANTKWRFLADDGPKLGTVTEKEPMMHNYFIQPHSYTASLEEEEARIDTDAAKLIMASNGWVMGDDPLRNFAEPGSNIYLRRELVAWGDSAKLRYGKKESDCPYLWQYMKNYTERTVKIFHGVRLDNCHSTPLHVAEYMLDAARKIRPDLYVVAELFTGNEGLDNYFLNKLGINSLIREALSARTGRKLGELVYRYGGQAVGSFIQPRVRPMIPTVAHALFFDQTHDNQGPVQLRSAYDLFPNAALVSISCCASGSNRGYDQIVPHHIHVVEEKRLYSSWSDNPSPGNAQINQMSGIAAGKTVLNRLHGELGKRGFSEVFVDHVRDDVISITRHNPHTHDSVVLIARTAFHHPNQPHDTGFIPPVTIQGIVTRILFEGRPVHTEESQYKKDKYYINGLPDYILELKKDVDVGESCMARVVVSNDTPTSEVHLHMFTPGSVIAFRCEFPTTPKNAILKIRRGIGQFGYLMRSYSGRTMFDETWDKSNFQAIVGKLTLSDLNRVLYRCDPEERDDGKGFGSYDIPQYGQMVYCGLRGLMAVLSSIRSQNDLGHPLCNNLRNGDWLPSYVANRLLAHDSTCDLGHWFREILGHLSEVPRFLIPCYFDAVITGAYVVLRDLTIKLMSDFVKDGSTFVQALALGSVQFCGFVWTAKLPPLSPNLADPVPPIYIDKDSNKAIQTTLSLAAGFSHFASGYMRNWGRDTFIALRGLLLLTGRYTEARYIILSFGGCLRHGLIPNLLNEGSGARYNCRDAVWWWLQSIQDYCNIVKGGYSILQDKVSRLYPTDDSPCQQPGTYDQRLCDVIQEALQRHAEGLKYRERNAGKGIDENMSDEGFDNEIGVRWDEGFVFGGNEWNCGTWMDKMGGSDKAGNRGKPATPRNGSAVEMVGLCKSAVRWLDEMHQKGLYPHDSVNATINCQVKKVTFKEWNDKIQASFEKYFWINSTPIPENEPHPELINRRGMYKDTYLAKPFWTDFQLRPNFPVAMVVAPELFTPENAWTALLEADDVLVGPLGMKTLDPSDWSYVGDYDNSNDSSDLKVAHGFNYHQGPEWVWPLGYYLRARLHYARILNKKMPGLLKTTVGYVKSKLTTHYQEVMSSPWQSLPELTNSNGKYCRDSCRAQAWSVGCILEVMYDLEQLEDSDEIADTAKIVAQDMRTITV
ncbi:glycogen debranching enzyme-like [Pecten maximus]|uniref:glycogen debranching enzyme-like n=1 Tax=Pecten maximus TaxID=6579 RepID=UPI0014587F95|nr:glycogen debranching enzyme-like [Pecten maximus]